MTPGWWHYALDNGEPVFGLGEKWAALNRRGQLIHNWNEDATTLNSELSYKNTPFAWSPEGWGLFTHTPSKVTPMELDIHNGRTEVILFKYLILS